MKSMTAYAQVYKKKNSQSVQLIFRSMNFKYLDVSVHNLPQENILLGEQIKKEVKKHINRGKVEVYVFIKEPEHKDIHIDEETLQRYLRQIKRISRKHKVSDTITMRDILNLPYVVSCREKRTVEEGLVLPTAKQGLRKLLDFKKKEGRVVQREMLKNVKGLESNVIAIGKLKPHAASGVENNKEDIDEEVSLMAFYIKKLAKRINEKSDSPKGKSIDFLTQEILRELNAASSKTKKKALAERIVESKNYLERIREQAQNVE